MKNGKKVILVIEEIRKENNETKLELSKKLGISYSALYWEQQKKDRNISPQIINKILFYYKLTKKQSDFLMKSRNENLNEIQIIFYDFCLKNNITLKTIVEKTGIKKSLISVYIRSGYISSEVRKNITNKLLKLYPNDEDYILKMDKFILSKTKARLEETKQKQLSYSVDNYGFNLRKIRFEKKLTQRDVAKKLNLTHQQIENIEKGKSKITPSIYLLLLKNNFITKKFALENIDNFFFKRKKEQKLIIKIAILNNLTIAEILNSLFYNSSYNYFTLSSFCLNLKTKTLLKEKFNLTEKEFCDLLK